MCNIVSRILDISFKTRFIFIIVLVFSFYGYIDIWYNTSILNVIKWFLISILFSLLLSFPTGLKNKMIIFIGSVLCIVQILLCISNFFCYQLFGFGFNERMLNILLETNSREILEFLSSFSQLLLSFIMSYETIVMFFLLIILLISVRYCLKKIYSVILIILLLVSLSLSLLHILISEKGKRDIFMLTKTAIWMNYSFQMKSMMMSEQNGYYAFSPVKKENISFYDELDNIVLVIGESSCKDHWQLYGYDLPTTPNLQKIHDSIFIFKDVLPSYSTTSEALQCVLTTKQGNSEKPWYYYADIISLSKAAGYKVSWLSNQEKVSEFGASIGFIADLADYKHYEDETSVSSIIGEHEYDDILVKRLCESLKDTIHHQLIILHTMGSHTEYKYRYPACYNHFKANDIRNKKMNNMQRKIVAQYDNSIIYTDKVLSQMIDSLANNPKRNILLYLSDHSEDVFETSNICRHAFVGSSVVKVPMIMWMSNNYCESHPEIVAMIRKRVNDRISSENIIYSMINMMGIKCDFYNYHYDFLSSDYHCGKRYFEGKPFLEDND